MSSEERDREGETPLEPDAVTTGTSVLIAGPAMTGKRRLLFDLVGGAPDRSAIFVTTKRDAGTIQEAFLSTRPEPDDWETTVVDCVSRSRSFDQVRDSEDVRYVTSASDLTGIGIAASGFMRRFYEDQSRNQARFGLHTLSTLLMYADLRRVYQFVHVLTGRIEAAGSAGAFVLDTTSLEGETVSMLTQLFDAMVAVRDDESGPQLRVRGGDFGPRSWTSF